MAKVLLIVYDNTSHTPFFPQGIAYLGSALKQAGHIVDYWLQDLTHLPETLLTRRLDEDYYDIVGLGFVAGYYQHKKAIAISQAVNRSVNRSRFKYVLGGHGPAGAPTYFLNKLEADLVVVGEGETWAKNIGALHGIYCPKPIEHIEDFQPDYGSLHPEVYRLIRWPTSKRTDFCMPILSGRGCPWHCNFCYRMVPGFRAREPKPVYEEMIMLNINYRINHFQFSDELFMSSEERVTTFCEYLLEHNGGWECKWDCNGRLNFAKPEILKLMRRAGCEYINYGIESMDQKVLDRMKKGITVEMIEKGIKGTLEAGISPGLNFLWGNIGDSMDSLCKAVDFLLEHDPCDELRTIRPVTPYPGCELYKDAIEMKLLRDAEDFYKKHVNSGLLTVNFTDILDKLFHVSLAYANKRLIKNYYNQHRDAVWHEAMEFYKGKVPDFRGFRVV